jgi:Spy/CpxP family protein refolding chaperone
MSEEKTSGTTPTSGGWRSMRWTSEGAQGGLMVGLVAGGASAWAFGRDGGPGGFMGHRHFLHGRHRGPVDPAAARQHVEMGVRWVLGTVDATPEQEQRVKAIAVGALDDLLPLRERHQANRKALHTALAGATVDRAALEAARRDELKLAEEASVRLLDAIADAAEVLTPEQRAELAEFHQRFHR